MRRGSRACFDFVKVDLALLLSQNWSFQCRMWNKQFVNEPTISGWRLAAGGWRLAAGRPNGNAEAYWFAAQREIVGASLGSFAPMIAPEVSDNKPTRNAKAARKRRAS
jgi:hypothetical protein